MERNSFRYVKAGSSLPVLPSGPGPRPHAQICKALAQRGCWWFEGVHLPWAEQWTWTGQQTHLKSQKQVKDETNEDISDI